MWKLAPISKPPPSILVCILATPAHVCVGMWLCVYVFMCLFVRLFVCSLSVAFVKFLQHDPLFVWPFCLGQITK
jgi:hypothetical protein